MYDLNDPVNRGYQMGLSNNAFIIKKYDTAQRSFVGIGSITNAPVSFEIHGTDAVLMPAGETSDRPLTPVQGHMRFNKTQQTFEGYASGAWGSLGGVKSTDQRTYITAENGGNLTFISNDATLLKIAATSNVTVYGNLTATGVGTTGGNITATSFVGIGSSITQINAGNISSGTLAVTRGGTGVGTVAPTNGQLLIGNGSTYTLAPITAGTGVTVTNGAGSISLAIGQGVGIGSSVQFGSIGVGTAASGVAGEVKASGFVGFGTSITQLNAGNIAQGTLAVARGGTGVGTVAPANGQLLIGNGSTYTLAPITGGTGVTVTNGAGSISLAIGQGVGIGSSVQFGSIGVGTAASGVAGEVKASGFVGFGTSITQLNAGNIATGTLAVTRGGTGVGTSTGTGSVVLSASPTLTGTVTGDTFSGNGSLLTNLNATNVSTGTLAIARGGTGTATLTSGKVLVGNDTTVMLQPTNLHWDNINGRLGIGNASPTQTLHVSGNITSTGSIEVGTQFLGLAADTVGAPSFSWTNDANTGMYRPGTDMLGIVTGGIERVRVLANGDVGIGTTAPESKVQINGTVNIRGGSLGIGITPAYQLHLSADSAAKPATTTWTVSSDERLKTDVKVADYDRCYEIVRSLDLKSYNWNSNIPQLMQSVGSDHHRLGWIAQELEPIFPKAINVVPDLYGLSNVLNVNFDQLYAVEYGAVKNIIAKLAILMDKFTNMEREIVSLKQISNA